MKVVKLGVIALGMGAQVAQGNISDVPQDVPDAGTLTFGARKQRHSHQQVLSLSPHAFVEAEAVAGAEDNMTATVAPVTSEPALWLYPTAVLGPAFLVVSCGVLRRQCGRKEGQPSQAPIDRLGAENAVGESP